MQYYVYKVEKIECYTNTATTIDYDYTKDFNELKNIREYYKLDYFITDSKLENDEVYFTGDLIKIIEKVAEFEGEPITIKTVKK